MTKVIRFAFYSLFFLSVFSKLSYSQNVSENIELPFPTSLYQEINDNQDVVLHRKLKQILTNNKKWKKLISQKRMAVGLVDLRDKTNIRYAAVNGEHMMYAASLPKIAVLLAAMVAVKEGCLIYDDQLKDDLKLMITKSNNAATTRVIELLGFEKIADVMKDDKYNLYDFKNGGGLWVGKKYAKAGKRNPDPLKGLSHAATVEQVCRYYTLLAYGKLVDKEYSKEMLSYLIDPQIHHKFVNTLDKIAPGADVYRKSGSWKSHHSDSVLVYGEDGRKYILVALIEDKDGSKICRDLVNSAEKALGLNGLNIPSIKSAPTPIMRPK
jgi:beta-lactamase class A